MWTIIGDWLRPHVQSAVAFLVGLCIAGASASFAAACNAAQQRDVANAVQTAENDARKLEPVVFGGCGLVETAVDVLDPPAAGAVDVACSTAEDVDKGMASLATVGVNARVVGLVREPPAADGGLPRVRLRVRCTLKHPPSSALDGGADASALDALAHG